MRFWLAFGGFWDNVAAGFVGNLAAGGLLVGAGYFFIDRRWHLRERAQRQKDEAEQQRDLRERVLRSVLGELESNAARVTTVLEEIPKGAVVYPLFDLPMWSLLAQSAIFTTLKQDTIGSLIHAYNRMATANEQNAFLADLNHGPTAILVASSAASSFEDPLVKETYERFQKHREALRVGLVERVTELKGHLDTAIDAVERDLGMTPQYPAAQRRFQAEGPTGIIGIGDP